MYVFMEK